MFLPFEMFFFQYEMVFPLSMIYIQIDEIREYWNISMGYIHNISLKIIYYLKKVTQLISLLNVEC